MTSEGEGVPVCKGGGTCDPEAEALPAGAGKVLWHIPELEQLDQAMEEALRAEEEANLSEPESEEGEDSKVEAAGGAAAEACLEKVKEAIVRSVAAPLKNLDGPEGVQALKVLPSVIEELAGLLHKAFRLSAVRARRQSELLCRVEAAETEAKAQHERANQAEVARLTAEADAGHGEKAHELLEGTLARLTATRKTLKEREWELADAKRRQEQAEEERVRLEVRTRTLQTSLERANSSKFEATKEAERRTDAANQELVDELQRRVAAAELAAEEANMLGEHRVRELELRLGEGARRAEELDERLQSALAALASASAGSSSSGGPHGSSSSRCLRLDASSTVRHAVPSLVGFSLSSLRGQQESFVEGVGILTPTPRRSLRSSLNNRGGVEVQSPPKPVASQPRPKQQQKQEERPPKAEARTATKERQQPPSSSGHQRRQGHAGGPAGSGEAPSMPMDLMSLGKLLSGGRVVEKKGRKP